MDRFGVVSEIAGIAKDKKLVSKFSHLKANSIMGFPIVLLVRGNGKILKMENFLLSSRYKEEPASCDSFLLLKQGILQVVYFKQLESFVLVPLTTFAYGFPCKILANEYKRKEMFVCPGFQKLPEKECSFNFVDHKIGIYYTVEFYSIDCDPSVCDFSVPEGKFPVLLGNEKQTIGLWQYDQYTILPKKQRTSNTKIDDRFKFVADECRKLQLC